jgi:hypothetical protein
MQNQKVRKSKAKPLQNPMKLGKTIAKELIFTPRLNKWRDSSKTMTGSDDRW